MHPPYTQLISATELQTLMDSGAPVYVFDCSFELQQPQAGREHYLQGHIPGAAYADLSKDLSASHAKAQASGGRHPLPRREDVAAWLSRIGFDNSMQAVVYDRQGMNFCVRLWWMLKWAGHENVAVLDGGLPAWQAAGGKLNSGPEEACTPRTFVLQDARATLVDANTIAQHLGNPQQTLMDARAAARFRGEVEALDPVAGHIPGALNRPFALNLGPDGRFKLAAQLHTEFKALLGARDAASVVHYCGSGVSALPNLLAMEIAGLGRSALYAGSWSDWCSQADRPVEKTAQSLGKSKRWWKWFIRFVIALLGTCILAVGVLVAVIAYAERENVGGIVIPQLIATGRPIPWAFNYRQLISESLQGNSQSFVELVNSDCGAAGCYDHGYVLMQILLRIGEKEFITMAQRLNPKDRQTLELYLSVGILYGVSPHQKRPCLTRDYPKLVEALGGKSVLMDGGAECH